MPFLLRWFSLCNIDCLQGAVVIIYTESDYLEAHLTGISADARDWPTSRNSLPERLNAALKKMVTTAPDERCSPKSRAATNRTR